MQNREKNNSKEREIKKGEIFVTGFPDNLDEDEWGDEDTLRECFICDKDIEYDESYVCLSKSENTKEYYEEIVCCSKKCWNEYILREAEEVRIMLK